MPTLYLIFVVQERVSGTIEKSPTVLAISIISLMRRIVLEYKFLCEIDPVPNLAVHFSLLVSTPLQSNSGQNFKADRGEEIEGEEQKS